MLSMSFQGCRSVEEFQCLNRIEEGTYGVVYRAKDKKTGGCQCPPLSSGYLGLHFVQITVLHFSVMNKICLKYFFTCKLLFF